MAARATAPPTPAAPNRLTPAARAKARPGQATPAGAGSRQGSHVIEMQRRRLLLGIGEVIGESGIEAATVGRVCAQAGVSRRTFYEIFADREECLLAAFDSQIERIAALVAPVYAGAGRWAERVRAALCLLLERLDAEPDLARLLVVETPRAGPTVLDRRRRVLEALALAVDEGRTASRAGADPPPLTAQGVVGGALSVIHERLLASVSQASGDARTADPASHGVARPRAAGSLGELAGPLMAMIVLPYLGPTAAREELERPVPKSPRPAPRPGADPFRGLPIRFTYRTALVMATIASEPGASNRRIADRAGIADEGQTSRLLRRLQSCELIENRGEGHPKGSPNAWELTERGEAIQAAITVQATR
jgi:AcrR family transcriptional regulator